MIFFRMMGRLTVRFFTGLGRIISGIFRSGSRHPLGTLFTVLLIGGVVAAWIVTDGFGISLASTSDSSVVTSQPSTQATGKSQEFLNAFGKLDTAAMWKLLNGDLKKTLSANGIADSGAMQKAINAKAAEIAKGDSKPKYRFEWNNGKANSDGTAFDLFVGEVDWPQAGGAVPKQVLYGVTTDKDGNVKDVLSQMARTPDPGDPLISVAFPTDAKKTGPKAASGQGTQEAGSGAPASKRNPVTEELMAGLTNFDAKRVWNSLSPTYQKELNGKGVTVDTMQAAFDGFKKDAQTKKTKLAYVGYTYQVTTSFNNAATDVYVSALQYDDTVLQFEYVILLDSNNKVIGIGTGGNPDPILSKGLGRSQQQ